MSVHVPYHPDDPPVVAPDRQRPPERPPVFARSVPQPVLDLVRLPRLQRAAPRRPRARLVLGVEHPVPRLPVRRSVRHPRELVPPLIVILVKPVRARHPDHLRHRVGEPGELLGAPPQVRLRLLPPRHVERHPRHPHHVPERVVRRPPPRVDPVHAPVRPPHPVFRPVLLARHHRPADRRPHPRPVLLHDRRHQPRVRQRRVRRQPEVRLTLRRTLDRPRRHVQFPLPDRPRRERERQPFPALGQRLLVRPPPRHVHARPSHVARPSVRRVEVRPPLVQQPPDRPVRPDHPELHVEVGTLVPGPRAPLDHARPVGRVHPRDELVDRPRAPAGRHPEQPVQVRVPRQRARADVPPERTGARRVERGLQPLRLLAQRVGRHVLRVHVRRHAHPLQDPPGRPVADRRRPPQVPTVLTRPGVVDPVRVRLHRHARAHARVPPLGRAGHVVRVQLRGPARVPVLLRGRAQLVPPPVVEIEAPVRRGRPDDLRERIGDPAEPRLLAPRGTQLRQLRAQPFHFRPQRLTILVVVGHDMNGQAGARWNPLRPWSHKKGKAVAVYATAIGLLNVQLSARKPFPVAQY